jgi:murein DD-endopeptidase MepM/ murein hydrolase activator NlpD
MRRLAALALMLAACAGTARADTFSPVGPTLPPVGVPNLPGSISLAPNWTQPPAQPEQLSYAQLQSIWQRAGATYGVPWQVLAAIDKVESNFGRNMGPSSAGAIGWMQFMPSTWLRWGTDANGDGIADPWSAEDAIFSAARYLAASGGANDLYGAVFSYNHADWYVREVLDLARLYGQDTTVVFSLDRLQVQLHQAQEAVVHASDATVAAHAALVRVLRQHAQWLAKARDETLLSNRLEDEQRAGAFAPAIHAAHAQLAHARAALATAQQALASARTRAESASFNSAAGMTLQAPVYSGGYVFPVGGGPGVVSAAHTHHDYPAVDIAAPEGSPEYALADSVVLNAWRYPDPRCGIGMTIRAFDGQVWTYCHMAELDPAVAIGAQLKAGQPVGLVGMTGDASGPHLHLQLQPPTEWPQREAWFQSFAGTAFSWQDAPTPAPTRALASAAPAGGPVFAVVAGPAPAPQPEQTAPVVYFNR